MKIIFTILICISIFSVKGQPPVDRKYSEGLDTSLYKFINPCTSFITVDSAIKNIGSVYNLPVNILKQKTYCIYGYHYDGRMFDGDVEIIDNIKIPIKKNPSLVIDILPRKNKKYVYRKDISIRVKEYYENLSYYIRSTKWDIKRGAKTVLNDLDSIYILRNKKPTFGDYMALISTSDFNNYNIIELSYYLTKDSSVFNSFYRNYYNKDPGELNLILRTPECEFTDNCPIIFNPFEAGDGYEQLRTLFNAFYDYIKPRFGHDNNVEALIKRIYEWIPQSEMGRIYYKEKTIAEFKSTQFLLDRLDGQLTVSFKAPNIALEINSNIIRPANNRKQNVKVIESGEVSYTSLPYELLAIQKEHEESFPKFEIGLTGVFVTPKSYKIDMDINKNDIYLQNIFPFHETYTIGETVIKESDEYMKHFIGVSVENGELHFNVKHKDIMAEHAAMIIDDKEINGYFQLNNIRDKKSLKKIKNYLLRKHIKIKTDTTFLEKGFVSVYFNYSL